MENKELEYSIKDLEHLSNIKAHTIRIWEKRYNILQPTRTDSNIRIYNQEALQKLLNITLLHNHGYKISKISLLSDKEIDILISQITSEKSVKHMAIAAFKYSMINFDSSHFHDTYKKLLSEKSFREIAHEVFIPLLGQVYDLAKTNTITSAHEQFIRNLILQKLAFHSEKVSNNTKQNKNKVFVLFSPNNESDILGLLYLNFELLNKGYKTIFLGQNIPLEDLVDLKRYHNEIVYLAYFSIYNKVTSINEYIKKLSVKISDNSSEVWISGGMIDQLSTYQIPDRIKIFTDTTEVINSL